MSRGLTASALAVAASAVVGLSAVPAQADGVWLYQRENFEGGSAYFAECDSDADFSDNSFDNGRNLDNQASSVWNASGRTLDLMQYAGWSGETYTVGAYTRNSHMGGFSDKASSLHWWGC